MTIRQKIIISLPFLVLLFIILFVVFLLTYKEPPPQLFPLDDKGAIYVITKEDNFYLISYLSSSDRNKYTNCTYEGFFKPICKDIVENNITGFIASSSKDLTPYLGKNVILSGEFVFADKQCIAGVCKLDGTRNFVGLEIQDIKLNTHMSK